MRVVGVTLVALGLAMAGVGVWRLVDGDDSASSTERAGGALAAVVQDAGPAGEPFRGLTQGRVKVGDRKLRVVIADSQAERSEGLRRRRSLGRYGGMLFAYETPTTTGFTMSTVPVPLDVGFYSARGALVSRLRMQPCAGSDAQCPVYDAGGPFTYAVETLAGGLPEGRLKG